MKWYRALGCGLELRFTLELRNSFEQQLERVAAAGRLRRMRSNRVINHTWQALAQRVSCMCHLLSTEEVGRPDEPR